MVGPETDAGAEVRDGADRGEDVVDVEEEGTRVEQEVGVEPACDQGSDGAGATELELDGLGVEQGGGEEGRARRGSSVDPLDERVLGSPHQSIPRGGRDSQRSTVEGITGGERDGGVRQLEGDLEERGRGRGTRGLRTQFRDQRRPGVGRVGRGEERVERSQDAGLVNVPESGKGARDRERQIEHKLFGDQVERRDGQLGGPDAVSRERRERGPRRRLVEGGGGCFGVAFACPGRAFENHAGPLVLSSRDLEGSRACRGREEREPEGELGFRLVGENHDGRV